MRINSYLARSGIGSRRKVEELITSGKISVNGQKVLNLSTQIFDNDIVMYNGKIVKPDDDLVCFMLNKPKMVLSTVKDDRGRKTVVDIVKDQSKKLFPIGRLDFNTEGLLLLTNDGELANNIMHPSKKIGKTYLAHTIKPLKPHDLVMLRKGVVIDGIKTLPANIEPSFFDEVCGFYVTRIEIFEGRNREVRNMFSSLGYKIIELKRIKIGSLTLGDLKKGKYKKLTKEEVEKIFK